MIAVRPLFVSIAFSAVFLVLVAGCAFSRDMNAKFPVFPMAAKVDVFLLKATPEQKLCSIESPVEVKEFITYISSRYPDNWRRPSGVSLAPSYRVLIGTTEILILKSGMAISIATAGGERRVLVHSLNPGEAEDLILAVCKQQNNGVRDN